MVTENQEQTEKANVVPPVIFRLSPDDYRAIQRLVKESPRQEAVNVNEYAKRAVQWYLHRHDREKEARYRLAVQQGEAGPRKEVSK